ncbi:MAG TPA: methyltransferase domain-containing protein [Microbacteriaceae bacterium]|nr:methyltransferase domain-containing protein [Microbacteriaceae bacterium]
MIGILVCPIDGQRLIEVALSEAERSVGQGGRLVTRLNDSASAFGPTDRVLMRADARWAYPIVDGFPVLLAPERLFADGAALAIDLRDPRYEEAYEEMEFYNRVGREEAATVEHSEAAVALKPIDGARMTFPEPLEAWVDSPYEFGAKVDAYRFLAPLEGKVVLQVGGKGLHAVKFLLGGCAEAWLVAPMVGELTFATALAERYGVLDRLHCVTGIGEELPLASDSFDAVYVGGSLHHMQTDVAIAEIARVLRPGGRFAAVEPWKAALHGIGTRIFGKREPEVHCRPLTSDRLASMTTSFARPRIEHHGAISRYPMIAFGKLGIRIKARTAGRIMAADDWLTRRWRALHRQGSVVAVLGEKA